MQKFSDPPVERCPECGSLEAQRKVSVSAFHLKGGGWYKDGYGSKSTEEAKSKTDDTGKKETKKADSKKESKAEGTAKKETTKASAPKESSPKKAAATCAEPPIGWKSRSNLELLRRWRFGFVSTPNVQGRHR